MNLIKSAKLSFRPSPAKSGDKIPQDLNSKYKRFNCQICSIRVLAIGMVFDKFHERPARDQFVKDQKRNSS